MREMLLLLLMMMMMVLMVLLLLLLLTVLLPPRCLQEINGMLSNSIEADAQDSLTALSGGQEKQRRLLDTVQSLVQSLERELQELDLGPKDAVMVSEAGRGRGPAGLVKAGGERESRKRAAEGAGRGRRRGYRMSRDLCCPLLPSGGLLPPRF
jgi:hypothetical protein